MNYAKRTIDRFIHFSLMILASPVNAAHQAHAIVRRTGVDRSQTVTTYGGVRANAAVPTRFDEEALKPVEAVSNTKRIPLI